MATGFVCFTSASGQQPSDGTVMIDCNCVIAGPDVLGGHHLVGITVTVDPETITPNNLETQIADALRTFASIFTQATAGGAGVTIPANAIVLPRFVKG